METDSDSDDEELEFHQHQTHHDQHQQEHHNSQFLFSSVPRKSRSKDPNFSLLPNPNNLHETQHSVPNKKRRLQGHVSSSSSAEDIWTERAVALLLEVWGERFVRAGRRSLRSDEWREVAERVSEAARFQSSESQCRSVLESLKKRYKEERERFECSGILSNWGFYRKIESLLYSERRWADSSSRGLGCGVDSGEFVFADMRVYLDKANGFDEMRDSPAESEASGDEEGSDSAGAPVRELAESVERFREIYGKVESDKRRQMVELESMRVDFQRDLEIQKRQILERTRVEIAKIRAEDDDGDD